MSKLKEEEILMRAGSKMEQINIDMEQVYNSPIYQRVLIDYPKIIMYEPGVGKQRKMHWSTDQADIRHQNLLSVLEDLTEKYKRNTPLS